jgi:DNA-directed RNA polymerase specialized sigma24 family protein
MDQDRFERIFNSYCLGLVFFAEELVKNNKEAEKITVKCFKKLRRNKYPHVNENGIHSFLFMHARNAVISHLTRNKKSAEYISMGPDMDEAAFERAMIGAEVINLFYNKTQSFTPQLNEDHVSIIKDEINAELIRYLAKHPQLMNDMDPYKFEKLVAALMKDMGYDVYLTPQTRDGGRDIIAVMKTPSNDPIITIVECKRHRTDRPIGIEIVRSFLYTIREQDKANVGWIVTTSTFSLEAINEQKIYKWLLSLKDNKSLAAWCNNYGQWKRSSESGGLWLPNNPLA